MVLFEESSQFQSQFGPRIVFATLVMELIFDPTRSPEHLGKSHLNSDIGELFPKIKLYREVDADNDSKFAKKKKLQR